MNKTQLLKDIFNLAQAGIQVDLNNLPADVSKDVIEKNLLYIELKDLIKNNGSEQRIAEIRAILYPVEEDVEV